VNQLRNIINNIVSDIEEKEGVLDDRILICKDDKILMHGSYYRLCRSYIFTSLSKLVASNLLSQLNDLNEKETVIKISIEDILKLLEQDLSENNLIDR